MNNILNVNATGMHAGDLAMASVVSVISASRGILAQGIRVSSGSDLGLQGFATKAQAVEQIVIKQDKPMGAWHPAAVYAATGAVVIEAGVNPADTQAFRLRPNTHPATVIRSRHRSRLR
ncbi:hypothetical protein ACIP5Y_12820 [Nocardia sp. NPDC088792]|uniref:hypothetical protein n=1 Tax=Nocardia sp. NPDC088792 TaxID=3364332 RepID=UPI00380573BE